jgi:phospholipid-binding lipoprotein MlaA
MKSIMPRSLALMILLSFLAACSSTPPPRPQDYPEPMFTAERIVPADFVDVTDVYDPWQSMNMRIYNFNYHFDQWVFLPVVRTWEAVVPSPARAGVHNFFENFRDMRSLANSLLQASPTKAMHSTGRVLVNSTVGLFGLIDVASNMGIPKPDEDFGQTLGHWGVSPGPYLVIPLLGPSNLRDGIGEFPDLALQSYLQNDLLSQPLRTITFLFDSIDTREHTSFRYYETGSAFEYRTVRWLYTTKRELDVEK